MNTVGLILLFVTAASAKELFTNSLDTDTSNIVICKAAGLNHCTRIDISQDIIENEESFEVDGETFFKKHTSQTKSTPEMTIYGYMVRIT
jgi:hypothetical protein